jgi:O-antigen/teichoic acid export membrane protein
MPDLGRARAPGSVSNRRGRVARDTAVLAVGSALNGVLAYVFFAIVTRSLGAEASAPVSVLWAYWSLAAAALAFPLQHWAARSVAVNGDDHVVRRSLPALSAVVLTISPLVGFAAWLAREPLFHRGDAWFPALVALSTVGSALTGLVRGMLQAQERFSAVAWSLVLENLVRCVVSLALAAGGNHDPAAYGVALIAGYATGFLWPWTLRMTRRGGDYESPLALLAGASGGQLLSQIVLTGGPVLLALTGGSPAEVTILFAGLALFRAPYTLSIGMVAQLTARFTALVVEGRRAAMARIRWTIVVATAVLTVLAAPVGALLGPALLPLVFGNDVRMPGRLTAVLGSGSTVAIAALVMTLLLIALGRTAGLMRAWLIAAVPGVAYFVLWPAPALDRTCWVFLVVEVGAFAWMVLEHVRGTAALRPTSQA